jgi:hypothetical protein
MLTKTKIFFWSRDHKFQLWSHRVPFSIKYLVFPKMDIYKCPFFKNQNTFPKTILPKTPTYVENFFSPFFQKKTKNPLHPCREKTAKRFTMQRRLVHI